MLAYKSDEVARCNTTITARKLPAIGDPAWK
jgi:hypothetical protein